MSTPSSATSAPNSDYNLAQFGWHAPSSMPQLGALATFGGGASSNLPPASSPSFAGPSIPTSTSSTGGASLSGYKNTVTLQHLSGFGMRNLTAYGATNTALMDVYFKLVLDRQVVYVSEIVRSTLNPVWVPFQPEDTSFRDGTTRQLFSGTYFDIIVVRVKDRRRPRRKSRAMSDRIHTEDSDTAWEQQTTTARNGQAPQLLLEASAAASGDTGDDLDNAKASATVHTSAAIDDALEEEILGMSFNVRELELLPVAVSEISNLPLNTCLFEFNGRTYVRREVIELLIDSGVLATKHSRRKGSAIQLKEYSLHEGVESLVRILNTKRAIETHTIGNNVLKQQIQLQLANATPSVLTAQRQSALETRVAALRQQVALKRANVERLKGVMHDERKTFETDIHIPKALLSTMTMSMRYKDEKQGILERRCEVLRAAHKIRSRQAMLVKQLSIVYPIEYEGAGEYKIRGIKLTSADLTGGSSSRSGDEEIVSTALGSIAHLVFMLSKYLQVNLRYKVVPFSSRSYLQDEINDPHGEYPLYKRGADRERHERAILYLRKNVEQLLFSRGLDPTQGAPILARLKALTDAETSWLLSDRDFNNNNNNNNPSPPTSGTNSNTYNSSNTSNSPHIANGAIVRR